ncbi:MAG: hypothetical protein ACI4NM_11945 [Bullifex sp.]
MKHFRVISVILCTVLVLVSCGNNAPQPSPEKKGDEVTHKIDGAEISAGKDAYVLITNFATGYSAGGYEGDDHLWSYTVTSDTAGSRAAGDVSNPYNDDGVWYWDNVYISSKTERKSVDTTELTDLRDETNGIIWFLDDTLGDYSRKKVINTVQSLLSLGLNLRLEEETLHVTPSSEYLIDGKYLPIIFYDFGEERKNTFAYFWSHVYTKNSRRNSAAAIFVNTSKLSSNPDTAAARLKYTLSHEYVHLLHADWKYVDGGEYENKTLVHFFYEGLANYVADKETGADLYTRQGTYVRNMFRNMNYYHPLSSAYSNSDYGVGSMFFHYVEKKYGAEKCEAIMKADSKNLTGAESVLGLPFEKVYENFMLHLVQSVSKDDIVIEGIIPVDFADGLNTGQVIIDSGVFDHSSDHSFCIDEPVYTSEIGPMSIAVHRIVEDVTSVTVQSESQFMKSRVFYLPSEVTL